MKGNSPLFIRLEEYHNAIAPSAGDGSLMGKNNSFYNNIRRRKDVDPDGKFDIIAHGTSKFIELDHNGKIYKVNWRFVSRIIKKMPGYTNRKPVRLLSCNTGKGSKTFAQNLANKLNVIVYAPNKYLWAWPNGDYKVFGGSSTTPDYNDVGKFIPGGNRK